MSFCECNDYSPDMMAMGDCLNCGHRYESHKPADLTPVAKTELSVATKDQAHLSGQEQLRLALRRAGERAVVEKQLTRREMIRERLLSQVRYTNQGCREWTGSTSGDGRGGGYGRVSIDGATMAVHRVWWSNENGIIPHRKQIDHKCGNRLCFADDHLELVTHRENQRRRVKAAKYADAMILTEADRAD